jgi:hypothetical protein
MFQRHLAHFLVREHHYGVLEQPDICDTEHCIAEDQHWAFLKATQADTLHLSPSPRDIICHFRFSHAWPLDSERNYCIHTITTQ